MGIAGERALQRRTAAAAAVGALGVLGVLGALGALGAVHAASVYSEYGCGENVIADGPGNHYKKCIQSNGRTGLCLEDEQCHNNTENTIACGGDIIDTDVRIDEAPLTECGDLLWCCPSPLAGAPTPAPTLAPTIVSPSQSTECTRASENCPWCVGLYRDGGDAQRGTRDESGLYCGGALLSARVVLTSATCVRTTAREQVWARAPAARDPAHRYRVLKGLTHPDYNSGSHANDFGLVLLEEDVEWKMSTGGACVQNSLAGDCFIVTLDTYGNTELTPVKVRDGDCKGRNIPDSACGALAADAPCVAAPGAPVLCPADGQGGQAIAGVVRRHCVGGEVQLGRLELHADWLRAQLEQLGVPSSQHALHA